MDKFGDRTNDLYISTTDSEGSFSNSSVTSAPLKVKVFISRTTTSGLDGYLPDVKFDLYKNLNKLVVPEGNSEAKITVKFENGEISTYNLSTKESFTILHYNSGVLRYNLLIIHLTTDSKAIRCILEYKDLNSGRTTYKFTINPIGFDNAYTEWRHETYGSPRDTSSAVVIED